MSEEDENTTITILGKKVPCVHKECSIASLRFYEKNPRILSKLVDAGKLNCDNEEKQAFIKEALKQEKSVKVLLKSIQDHGGISEHLLVDYKTQKVIEGNSRLAALRFLSEKEEGKYLTAPCRLLSLDENQIDALLNQQHIDGKTEWSPYDKAYNAYHRVEIDKVPLDEYCHSISETKQEVKKQIEVIQLMREEAAKEEKFSYYELLCGPTKLKRSLEKYNNPKQRSFLLGEIKEPQSGVSFTALELRNDVPRILEKPKIFKRWMDGKIDFRQAQEDSKISQPKGFISKATKSLSNIKRVEIENLEKNEINALEPEIKKCRKELDRVIGLVKEIKDRDAT